MTYKETIQYLYSKLPMFSRTGTSAIKKDLTNTIALCKTLNNPHQQFKSIHIGGTNGKGSTSHMLAAILQKAGYKTGLYTSPHLRDFRERIRINGTMISEQDVINFTESMQDSIERIQPSFFELTVAMAFNHFAKHNVDIAIIEVGLGGRLDSTNIINPELSVITNIAYDHMDILGDTLEAIATEKAGIIKEDTPVVIGQRHTETDEIFLTKAKITNSEILFAEDLIEAKATRKNTLDIELSFLMPLNIPEVINLDLLGEYQIKNIKTVLSAINILQKKHYHISKEDILSGLGNVQETTGLMGRWHILSKDPLIICDTGHNEDGIKEVLKSIESTLFHELHIVIGMVRDKDISKVLKLLPKTASYYFCNPRIERAKPAQELADEAKKFGLIGDAYNSINEALSVAKGRVKEKDLIFVGGSTFVVAEVV